MRIVLMGGGGHASDVLGAIEAVNAEAGSEKDKIEIAGILADDEIDMGRFARRNVSQVGGIGDITSIDASHYISCVGYPKGRKIVANKADKSDKAAAIIIHPRAWVPAGTVIGPGTVVLAGVCVSPCAKLSDHVYLSHGSLVGHDCDVGDFVSIMPGAGISGDTHLGEGCLIGANATVLQTVRIGAWATLGAGAVAAKDVPENATAVGIPAKVLLRE